MTAFDSEPKLSVEELEALLEQFKKTDKEGTLPSVPEWIPSYNLNAAAAEGWRWKAGKASELTSVDLDGERMSSNQVFEHCMRMAKQYASRKQTTVSTSNV